MPHTCIAGAALLCAVQPAFAASSAPATQSLTTSRAARAVAPTAIVIPRGSCGTYWTGWVNDSSADVNPCPKGCERGKQLQLNEHKNGEVIEYQANYECYLPQLEVPQPALKARGTGAPPRQNCGTMWTGWQSDPNSPANPCPANCERGELRLVNRSLSNGKLAYDMNYQCYTKASPAAGSARTSSPQAPRPTVATTKPVPLREAGTAGPSVAGERRQIRAATIVMQGRWPVRQVTAVATDFVRMRGRWPVQAAASTAFEAATIRMTGRWPLVTSATAVATGTVRMTGRWPAATVEAVVASQSIRMTGRWPSATDPTVIATSVLRMRGRWPAATANAVMASESIRMTGRWPVSAGPAKLKTGAIRMTGRSPR